ncbi:MAG: dihydrolipoamide succinyltransferase, partial [Sphingomonas sp.]
MATEILVPTLGESITEATLGEWLKQPGDAVAADEPIASLETDKVSVEVPSPVAGVMGQHAVAVGDTVQVGAMLATVDAGGSAPAKQDAPQPAVTESAAPATAPAPADEPQGDAAAALSPSVRRAVLEHGVDPATIKGTGKDGRLTKEDVAAAASSKPAA